MGGYCSTLFGAKDCHVALNTDVFERIQMAVERKIVVKTIDRRDSLRKILLYNALPAQLLRRKASFS